MTRAEPVDMVIQTIESLISVKSDQDEILIVDNNHTNEALYRPLEEYCNSLETSLNVHFYHKDRIEGFKAGALNFALNLMDANCDYIVVVDSDYQAMPWARHSIKRAIERYPNHALLQFPQFYRDANKPDIHTELNHYFSYQLLQPHNCNNALSTGTFAVIKRQALIQLGGWCSDSITEDAQMGVLMHLHHMKTKYIPEVIATGVLPQNLSDLIAQRRRWIYGNMQVLASYPKWLLKRQPNFSMDNSSVNSQLPYSIETATNKHEFLTKNPTKNYRNLKLKIIYAHLSQLSAWINFTGVFILLHFISLVILAMGLYVSKSLFITLSLFCLSLCYLSYCIFLIRRLYAYVNDTKPLQTPQAINFKCDDVKDVVEPINQPTVSKPMLSNRIKAWLVHLNFWELGALSWLPVLWGQQKPFVCTPKSLNLEKTDNAYFQTLVVLPKLLLVLNVATAFLAFGRSTALFCFAVGIVLIKVISAWIVMQNFAKTKINRSTITEPDSVCFRLDNNYKLSAKPIVGEDEVQANINNNVEDGVKSNDSSKNNGVIA